MKVTVSGTVTELPDGSNLYDLVLLKKWTHVRMHIRVNGKEVPQQEYRKTRLSEGHEVQIIPQFGGG